jgi:hypothetical protein
MTITQHIIVGLDQVVHPMIITKHIIVGLDQVVHPMTTVHVHACARVILAYMNILISAPTLMIIEVI